MKKLLGTRQTECNIAAALELLEATPRRLKTLAPGRSEAQPAA